MTITNTSLYRVHHVRVSPGGSPAKSRFCRAGLYTSILCGLVPYSTWIDTVTKYTSHIECGYRNRHRTRQLLNHINTVIVTESHKDSRPRHGLGQSDWAKNSRQIGAAAIYNSPLPLTGYITRLYPPRLAWLGTRRGGGPNHLSRLLDYNKAIYSHLTPFRSQTPGT